jgi:hypothetical protein
MKIKNAVNFLECPGALTTNPIGINSKHQVAGNFVDPASYAHEH